VALRLQPNSCPCAIGTDTGGSVRIPSAFNGVVGYKTSCGRIDTNGMFPLARTYDTIGPLARSVEDCVLLDRALRGAISAEVLRSDPRELSLLYPTNVVMTDVQPAVAANFERSLEALAGNGVSIRHERIDVLDEILEMNARHGTLTAAEAYFEYQELVDSDDVKQIDRRVVKRIMDGKRMTAFDLLSIQRGRQAMIPKLVRQLRGALLVMPTSPITAPEVAPLEKSDEVFHKVNLLTLGTPCSETFSISAASPCRTALPVTACRRASCFRPRMARTSACSPRRWRWSPSSPAPAEAGPARAQTEDDA
jgi:aspartyl-tRNA(Asn)/glutamyl-tRNA(Gln) amidotransferase subunit A